MSREEIIPQLQARGIELTELKSSQESASVYQGTFQKTVVAIKILTLVPGAESDILEQESRIQKSLSHPNILPLYDCFWETNGSSHFYVIVSEWCDSDLGKCLKQRTENNQPWGEEEIWDLIRHLVDALAYMQKLGFSHRNIKPENIFLTPMKSAKLGDFGSPRILRFDQVSVPVAEVPFNLSPILRKAVLANNPKAVHNVYKSDVYSLGLTLFSLALLGPPLSLAKDDLTDEEVSNLISTVNYSYMFKSMLVWMLLIDEKSRCDFKILHAWLEHYVPRPDPPAGTPLMAPGLGQSEEVKKRVDGNDGKASIVTTTGKGTSVLDDTKKSIKVNESTERIRSEARKPRKEPMCACNCCSSSCSCW